MTNWQRGNTGTEVGLSMVPIHVKKHYQKIHAIVCCFSNPENGKERKGNHSENHNACRGIGAYEVTIRLVQNKSQKITLLCFCYFLCSSKESNQRKDAEIERTWWLPSRLTPISALFSLHYLFGWNRNARHHFPPASAAISVSRARKFAPENIRGLLHGFSFNPYILDWFLPFFALDNIFWTVLAEQ